MDFYKEKKMAQMDILRIVEKNEKVPLANLIFKITQRYGFGRKLIVEYLALLEKTMGVEVKDEFGDEFVINHSLIEHNKKVKENDVPKRED